MRDIVRLNAAIYISCYVILSVQDFIIKELVGSISRLP
jgi:hypothetical protein